MATFRVAGASEYLAITGWGVDDVKLAKKAWVWLGQRCTTLDVAPASYELEAHAATSDKFPVVLRAVYTVEPCIVDAAGEKKRDKDPPVLLYAKLVAPPSKKEEGCSSRVKELVQGARASVQASDTTKAEELKHGRRKAEAEYWVTMMKGIAGNVRARKDKKTKAFAERLQDLSDFLDKSTHAVEEDFQVIEERLRDTEGDEDTQALEARKHLLDELLAKADYAAADLEAHEGMVRGFDKATANMLRLMENIP